jgi:hypothetical protein
MQMTVASRLLALAIMATSVSACDHGTEAAATPPPTQTVSRQQQATAAAVARKLVEQDRIAEAAHRAEISRLIDATALQIRDADRHVLFVLQIKNKTNRAISALDAGLQVNLESNGKRVGLTELHIKRIIAPQRSVTFSVPLRYVRFGEDTASMRLAEGKPKRAQIEVTEIKYADGSDAGYDD